MYTSDLLLTVMPHLLRAPELPQMVPLAGNKYSNVSLCGAFQISIITLIFFPLCLCPALLSIDGMNTRTKLGEGKVTLPYSL